MNMHALYCRSSKKAIGHKDGPEGQKVLILVLPAAFSYKAMVLLPSINSQKNLSPLWSHRFQCPFSDGGREASMGN